MLFTGISWFQFIIFLGFILVIYYLGVIPLCWSQIQARKKVNEYETDHQSDTQEESDKELTITSDYTNAHLNQEPE